MSVKTAGVGHFAIPTAPAAGASVTSGAANTFTTTYVQLIASTAAALYITGIYVEAAGVSAATYVVVQLATGAAASEVIVGQHMAAMVTASTVTHCYKPIFPPIPVATGTRIAVKTADSVGAQATLITLECIAQSSVVDDAIPITTVTTVTTVTNQLTAAAIATGVWQDATAGDFTTASSIGKTLYIANIVPGGSGGLMISGSNAGTTTLGALTITGATTHTGATVHTGNVSMADGLTIAAPSTGNRAGLDIAGNGTGAALKLVAGATGVGFSIAGGGTSGDGIKVTTTSGHGMNLAPVGTSMHGLLATGGNGGTSDGIKGAAGTGGVDIRGAITGNVTGNLSGSVGSVTGAVGSVTGAVGSVTGAVGSVTGAVGSVTGLTASNLDTTISSRMATYTQPTGFLAATFPAGTVANTTNITAGTIATVTNLTNAPTAGDFTATMKTSIGTAVAASAVASVTGNVTGSVGSVVGAVGSVTGNIGGNVTGSVGSVTGLTASNLDATVSSRLATAGYTAPDNTSVGAIKTQTDKLAFTVANKLDVNILVVNGVTVIGTGAAGDRWRATGT